MLNVFSDSYYMKLAMQEATLALEKGEVPVGAIVVCQQQVIARAHNQTELLRDVTAHAEIIAITAASDYLATKYLNECSLYVTLEPCIMCAGALSWAQVGKIIYGASDDKKGFSLYGKNILHPKTIIEYGVLKEECGVILTDFFQGRRQ